MLAAPAAVAPVGGTDLAVVRARRPNGRVIRRARAYPIAGVGIGAGVGGGIAARGAGDFEAIGRADRRRPVADLGNIAIASI